MVFRLTLVHKLPKPFVGFLVIAPPEIAVAGLVERSPKHCYSLITEGGEFLRYGVDILNDSDTFFAYLAVLLKLFDILKAEFCDIFLCNCLFYVKICLVGIIFTLVVRGSPVPHIAHYAVL